MGYRNMGNAGICILNSTNIPLDCYLSMGAPHHHCWGLSPREAFVIYPGAVWYTVGVEIPKSLPRTTEDIVDLSGDPTESTILANTKLMIDNQYSEIKGVYCGKKGGTFFEAVICLLYTSPSPRDLSTSRMPSSA
eukprot:TRINITY_DN7100_c0_g1_i1.p2 TRINITY_DN7100_c0_g1~~TRINITY_DN7100_c0_g1_i1.p2  ORF type:complete len:135 (+),score=16.61 TRINITY_DN7100_c0_g1_i1:144-548(+)